MDFRKASLAELRQYAKDKGIRNISTLKKGELAELLENVEKMTSKKPVLETEETIKKTDNSVEEEKQEVKAKKSKEKTLSDNVSKGRMTASKPVKEKKVSDS